MDILCAHICLALITMSMIELILMQEACLCYVVLPFICLLGININGVIFYLTCCVLASNVLSSKFYFSCSFRSDIFVCLHLNVDKSSLEIIDSSPYKGLFFLSCIVFLRISSCYNASAMNYPMNFCTEIVKLNQLCLMLYSDRK